MVAAIDPIFTSPPHIQCPVGPLRVWFTEPKGAAVQLSEPAPFTESMARWLTGPGFDLLQQKFAGGTGLLFVLDIRAMLSREPVVRGLLMDKAREHADTFSDVFIVPPLQINPVYLTTLHAAAALVSAFGARVEITSDLAHVLARDRITALVD